MAGGYQKGAGESLYQALNQIIERALLLEDSEALRKLEDMLASGRDAATFARQIISLGENRGKFNYSMACAYTAAAIIDARLAVTDDE